LRLWIPQPVRKIKRLLCAAERVERVGGDAGVVSGPRVVPTVMGRLLNEILLRSYMAAFAIGVVIAAASLLG